MQYTTRYPGPISRRQGSGNSLFAEHKYAGVCRLYVERLQHTVALTGKSFCTVTRHRQLS